MQLQSVRYGRCGLCGKPERNARHIQQTSVPVWGKTIRERASYEIAVTHASRKSECRQVAAKHGVFTASRFRMQYGKERYSPGTTQDEGPRERGS